jgi:hypothetical protein
MTTATRPHRVKKPSPLTHAQSKPSSVGDSNGGVKVAAYRGDGSVMLAFNLDRTPEEGFAGFAIKCSPPKGEPFFLKNRLNFADQVTSETTPEERHAILTGSDKAPYQKFRWVDFSSWQDPGNYTYGVSAMYQTAGGGLEARGSASVSLELGPYQAGDLSVGFTRGFLSSQAYVDEFKNAPIRPATKSIDYDTKPFAAQYEWLGFHARKLIFEFLEACVTDKHSTVDLFAYDLDEPDFIHLLTTLGPRLRAFLDDAPLHTKPGAMEILAEKALIKSAGKENVKTGHFRRFAHNKVLIQNVDGKPVRVLTGSANFSVRGLYVQANNVLVFDDADTAAHYESAFEQAWDDMKHFSASEIAEGWIEMAGHPHLPNFALAFSPHASASVSLDRVAEAVKDAKHSIFFAIMELGGGGDVLSQIKSLIAKRKDIFTYGVTQSLSGASVYKPGSTNGILTPFAFLQKNAPAPFNAEISGGPGQVIHDKFIVIDFNGESPIVFTGSSNLAAGGEQQNGDNLIELQDKDIGSIYGVQAVGLVDHFHFRAVMKTATAEKPLTLSHGNWFADYFEKDTLHFRDRMLFCP